MLSILIQTMHWHMLVQGQTLNELASDSPFGDRL